MEETDSEFIAKTEDTAQDISNMVDTSEVNQSDPSLVENQKPLNSPQLSPIERDASQTASWSSVHSELTEKSERTDAARTSFISATSISELTDSQTVSSSNHAPTSSVTTATAPPPSAQTSAVVPNTNVDPTTISPEKLAVKHRYTHAQKMQEEREMKRLEKIKRDARKSILVNQNKMAPSHVQDDSESPISKNFTDKFRNKQATPNSLWNEALDDMKAKQGTRSNLVRSKTDEYGKQVVDFHLASKRITEVCNYL